MNTFKLRLQKFLEATCLFIVLALFANVSQAYVSFGISTGGYGYGYGYGYYPAYYGGYGGYGGYYTPYYGNNYYSTGYYYPSYGYTTGWRGHGHHRGHYYRY